MVLSIMGNDLVKRGFPMTPLVELGMVIVIIYWILDRRKR